MSKKKLSEEEAKASARQQIYTLENQLSKGVFSIEDIGDYIPGSLMIQDFEQLTNTYMNKKGCDILMHNMEELQALGPEYYKKFFPQDQIEKEIMPTFFDFIGRQDESEVVSFFQQVRAGEDADYKWYFTASKLLKEAPEQSMHKVIHLSIEVNSLGTMADKMNRLLDENKFMRENFKKFALLTKREKEIIELLVKGKRSTEIADILSVSHFTVRTHRRNIHRKLEINNFTELLKFALAFDLI